MSIDLEGVSCSEEAARLLPWYVTGQLSRTDAERVANHLQRCAICRSDAENEASVRALLKAEARVEYAPQAGLAKILSRIDELDRDAPVQHCAAEQVRRRFTAVRWLSAAVLVQAVALGWLGIIVHQQGSAGRAAVPYMTLSSDPLPPLGPHIRVVFAPTMIIGDLHALLARNNLVVVNGPSEGGVYTLASTDPSLTEGKLAARAATLREMPGIQFAEPAFNDAARSR
jgi:hypothetical protein